MKHVTLLLMVMVLVVFFAGLSPAQSQPKILIAYYSQQGHTRAMAEAVAQGARSVDRVTVKLLTVSEATNADVLAADAIIVGSPVHNGNIAVPVQEFINRWPFEGAPLTDKIGAAFVSAGGISAGEEIAQLGILHSMLIFNMIVVGGPDWQSAFGASAVTIEEPFGKAQEGRLVDQRFLKKAEALGKRVAELAVKWKSVRQKK